MIAPRCSAVVALLLALGACQGTPEATPPLPAIELDARLVTDARRRAEAAVLRRDNQERGFACGYDEAWESALVDARDAAPARWRDAVFGSVFTLGWIAFALGLLGVVLLALLLPRLRKGDPDDDDDDSAHGVLALLRRSLARSLSAFARLLRVELFDRAAAEARTGAIDEGREAARLLAAATASVTALGEPGAPHAAELASALSVWRDDVAALASRLEAHAALAPRLDPPRLLPRLVKTRRAAQQLRLELLRAELAGSRPDDAAWTTWRQLAEGRPVLPIDRVREARRGPMPPWTRPVGWAGVAGLALAVPMSAAWTAAGAFPLFFALLFALASLGATLTARVLLFRAGRLPLLPGFADRIARTLTWLALVATALVIASSMTASESGLDLGDPPPVERPAELRAPDLPLILPAAVPTDAPSPPPTTPR